MILFGFLTIVLQFIVFTISKFVLNNYNPLCNMFLKIINYFSSTKSKSYYQNYNLSRYKSLETYLNIYHNCIEKKEVITDTEICFSPNIKFGSTIQDVKRDNPHGCNVLESTEDITILFYRIKVGNYKFRLEMHFFKNKLVFFNYIYRSSQSRKMILNVFTKKYLNSKDIKLLDTSKIYLTDGLRNHLEIDNSVFLSVHYFTFKYGFFDYLNKMNKNHRMRKVKVQESDESLLLNRI